MQATKSLPKCLILWDFWVRSPSQWNVSFSLFVWRRLTGMLNCKKIISECGRTLCLPWYNWMMWAYLVVILLLLSHQLIFRFMLFMTHKRKPMLLLFIYAQNTRMVEWKSDCFLLKIVVQHLIPIEVQAELTDNQVLGDSSVPLQGSQPVVHLQGDHAGRQQYAEKSFEENFCDFDFQIIWPLKCVKSGECENHLIDIFSWTFYYSLYGVINYITWLVFTCAKSSS